MAIPESQLTTWSSRGSITQSAQTYRTIKLALESKDTSYSDKAYDIFLQGSYGNDTNVYADSDVDIVIKINSCFFKDLGRLSPDQVTAYQRSFDDAKYGYSDFRMAVGGTLSKRFEGDVSVGSKAVWIKPNGGRRNADVLVSAQFRRYHEFHEVSNQRYDEGIAFKTLGGKLIENFPKQHSANLTRKHQNTNNRLKPVVRIFKNMRNHMVDKKLLAEGAAPSYFIEGMLYNVPSDKFTASYADTVAACHDWLVVESDQAKLMCANYLHPLLRPGEHTSWPPENFTKFLAAVRDLWMKW
jgi:hypothetical protein